VTAPTLPSYLTEEVLAAIASTAGVDPDHAVAVMEAAQSAGLLVEDLTPPPREITDEDVAETAKWLAQMSEHPRYGANGYGWEPLLTQEGSVEHAHAAARERASGGDRRAIDAARGLLIDHIRRASGSES